MKHIILAVALVWGLGAAASPVAAQGASCPGVLVDGACYVDGGGGERSDPYWPTNTETAYYYGPYAYAPGYGPYLRLGGESGWNPNIGSTYNSYPPGDYYSDDGFPPRAVGLLPRPLVVRSYYGVPYSVSPCCPPGYVYWR